MAIKYCDYTNGSDSTGDGTAGNPYKTITQASTGLTGDDEVRCAKSPSPTAISVNLTWTYNSNTVVATGADITSEVSAQQYIGKATAGGPGSTEAFYRVLTVVYSGGNTTITLRWGNYYGTTATVPSVRLGVTDTGNAGGGQVQVVSSAGTSAAHPITISGGWNLSNATRDGHTWFYQSGATDNGTGLQNNRAYIKMQHMGFLRYGSGVYSNAAGHVFEDLTISGGIDGTTEFPITSSSTGATLTRCTIAEGYYGIDASVAISVTDCYFLDIVGNMMVLRANNNTVTGSQGYYSPYGSAVWSSGSGNSISNCTFKYCSSATLALSGGSNVVSGCTISDCNGIGISSSGSGDTISGCTLGTNVSYDIQIASLSTVTNCHAPTSTSYYAVINVTGNGNTISNCSGAGYVFYGIKVAGSNNVITDCSFPGPAWETGIYVAGNNNHIQDCTCSGHTANSGWGIELYSGYDNVLAGCTTSGNKYGVISTGNTGLNTCDELTATGNSVANVSIASNKLNEEFPVVGMQYLNGVAGADYQFYEYGTSQRDDTTYNTAAPSLKFTPTSATYYIRQDFIGIAAAAQPYTLGIYLRKSATFNGSVVLEAYDSDGAMAAGPTTVTLTESFVQHTMLVPAMTVGDTVTLRVRVRGTAGTVWADDFDLI